MLIKIRLFALFSIIFLCFTACDKDMQDNNFTEFDNGIYVANEGVFNGGNGTVSYISFDGQVTANDLIKDVNPNIDIGNIVQGIAFGEDYACVTANNAGQAMLFDVVTWEYKKTIYGLKKPRYPYFINGLWYITEWGNSGNDGGISVYLESGEKVGYINTGGAPEKMLEQDGKLYVTMSLGFNTDNRLIIIDLASETILKTLSLGTGPNSIVKNSDNVLYVLCGGDFVGNESRLVVIKNDMVEKSILLQGNCSDLSIYKDILYFHSFDKVYKAQFNSNQVNIKSQSQDASIYGLGVSPFGEIYITNAKDFNSQGELIQLDNELNPISTLSAGVVPGQIFFREKP